MLFAQLALSLPQIYRNMTSLCPLCGKNKPDDALFCEQCAKKIRADYEIDVPEASQQNGVHEKTEQTETIEKVEKSNEPPSTCTPVFENPSQKKRNRLPIVIGVIALFVLVGGFLFFNNNTSSQTSRLEQADWQIATQSNSIAAFQTFIETHPFGQHTAQAIENIRMLRQQETEAWEAIRETSNIAVLQEFVNRYPENPHVVQAKARIELLTWERNNPPPPISFGNADDADTSTSLSTSNADFR